MRAIPRRTTPCGGVESKRLALEVQLAGVRAVEPGDHVERGGLAGAVRADQADDLALAHVERDVVQRDDAAEAAREVLRPRAAASGVPYDAGEWKRTRSWSSAAARWARASRGTCASSASTTSSCSSATRSRPGRPAVGRRHPRAVLRRAEHPDRAPLARGVRADGRDRLPPVRLPVPARPRPRTSRRSARRSRSSSALGVPSRELSVDEALAIVPQLDPTGCSPRRTASSTATRRPSRSCSGTRAGSTSGRAAR